MTRSCRRWGMQPSHPGAARRRCAEAQATHVKLFQYPDDACVVVFIPDDREVVKSGLRLPDDGAQDRVMGASPETAHGSGFVVQSVEKAGARSPLGEVHCESRRAHAAPRRTSFQGVLHAARHRASASAGRSRASLPPPPRVQHLDLPGYQRNDAGSVNTTTTFVPSASQASALFVALSKRASELWIASAWASDGTSVATALGEARDRISALVPRGVSLSRSVIREAINDDVSEPEMPASRPKALPEP